MAVISIKIIMSVFYLYFNIMLRLTGVTEGSLGREGDVCQQGRMVRPFLSIFIFNPAFKGDHVRG